MESAGNRMRLTYPDNTYITYDYDELNRMTAVRDPNGVALASYSFDDRSRRTGLAYANGACVCEQRESPACVEDHPTRCSKDALDRRTSSILRKCRSQMDASVVKVWE